MCVSNCHQYQCSLAHVIKDDLNSAASSVVLSSTLSTSICTCDYLFILASYENILLISGNFMDNGASCSIHHCQSMCFSLTAFWIICFLTVQSHHSVNVAIFLPTPLLLAVLSRFFINFKMC